MKNKMIRKITSIVIGLIFISNMAWSGTPGTTSMNFLKIGVNVRAVGMGEAYTAVSDDLGSLYYNPAGLAQIDTIETQFMYNRWFQDINSQYLAGAIPYRVRTKAGSMKNIGTFALGITRLGMDDIQGYDNMGGMTQKLQASDMAVSLGYGTRLTDNLMAGLNAKYLTETLADVNASAYASDIGLLYKTDSKIGIGASAQNLGTKVKFIKESAPLPQSFKIGASYQKEIFNQPLLTAIDVTVPNDNDTYVSGGVEYWIKDMIALRAGYRTGVDVGEGIRAGIGFKTSIFQIDYAFAGFGELGSTHRMSLTIRFGEKAQMDRTESLYNKASRHFEEKRYALAVEELNKLLEIKPGDKKALTLLNNCYNYVNDYSKKLNDEKPNEAVIESKDITAPQYRGTEQKGVDQK
jgi:hypothetical protein